MMIQEHKITRQLICDMNNLKRDVLIVNDPIFGGHFSSSYSVQYSSNGEEQDIFGKIRVRMYW